MKERICYNKIELNFDAQMFSLLLNLGKWKFVLVVTVSTTTTAYPTTTASTTTVSNTTASSSSPTI